MYFFFISIYIVFNAYEHTFLIIEEGKAYNCYYIFRLDKKLFMAFSVLYLF